MNRSLIKKEKAYEKKKEKTKIYINSMKWPSQLKGNKWTDPQTTNHFTREWMTVWKNEGVYEKIFRKKK